MLSKPHESTKVDGKIQIETSTKMYTPFLIGLINDMDPCAFRVLNSRQWSLAKHVV